MGKQSRSHSHQKQAQPDHEGQGHIHTEAPYKQCVSSSLQILLDNL